VRQNLRAVETLSMATVTPCWNAIRSQRRQKHQVAVELRSDFQFAGQSELAVVVLLNLMRNALKAMQRAGKGRCASSSMASTSRPACCSSTPAAASRPTICR
jgi:two-component system CAI-1 autoinducer sensor kinase/phosphatase CqsS